MREIALTQGQVAIVDDDLYDWLNQWKWYAAWSHKTRSFYAVRAAASGGRQKTIMMHRVILGCLPRQKGDHIHHNTLDNRRSELRICTGSENNQNQRPRAEGTSRFKGVSWSKDCRKWRVRIKLDGRDRHLGYFGDERSAALVYDAKARELFGEFAHTNL